MRLFSSAFRDGGAVFLLNGKLFVLTDFQDVYTHRCGMISFCSPSGHLQEHLHAAWVYVASLNMINV